MGRIEITTNTLKDMKLRVTGWACGQWGLFVDKTVAIKL